MRISSVVALLASLFVPVQPARAQLTGAERALVASIDARLPEAVALLRRMVDINSGTMNFKGVRQVGAVLAPEFEALGMQTEWVDGAAWNRSGHLMARSGKQGLHLLLIGHLDTVFEPDSPFQEIEAIDERHMKGPGITDMKGGNVVMLLALQALHEAGLLERCRVTVVLTGDEEKAGRPLEQSRQHLIDAAREADVALGFEDGDGDPRTAVIARRGASGWRLEVTGTPAHSSQIFREDIGVGAIFESARILAAFADSLSGEDHLTFNPGVIVGGTQVDLDASSNRGNAFGKTNVIPASTQVIGDLRSLSIEQRERAKGSMQRIVARSTPHTSAQITFRDGYPPMAPTDGNRRLLGLFDQASRDLGFGPVDAVDPARAGAADVAFAAQFVPMVMDGVGLMGTGGHTTDETADLDTLPVQAKRVAVLLGRLIATASQ
jgi:glutamate carboxypeptidase